MNSSRQHYQIGGHLKIFENSFYVSFDARNNLTINYNEKKQAGAELCRVSKCRGRGGQRPRKFVVDSRKNLSKICKSTNFRLFV